MTPEQIARQLIDQMLVDAGWVVQNVKSLDFSASIGIADDSLGDLDNLPNPDELALDIVENLESALGSFPQIVSRLQA